MFTVLLSQVKLACSSENQTFVVLKYKSASMLKGKKILLQQWNASLYSAQGLKSKK